MFRLLKALPLTLALAALIIFAAFAASCGSSNSQARFVNAIPDAGVLDIDVGGTKEFSSVAFATASGSTYVGVPSGSVTIEGLASGTTTEAFTTSGVSLNSGSEYTLVAVGFLTGTVNVLNPVDNNTEPLDGKVAFRVINASPSGPSSVDVYFIANPVTCQLGSTGCTPSISSLAYQSTSTYVSLNYNSNGMGYQMYLTTAGSTTPIFSGGQTISAGSSSLGSIRTIVLTDISNGGSLNSQAIVLDDLN